MTIAFILIIVLKVNTRFAHTLLALSIAHIGKASKRLNLDSALAGKTVMTNSEEIGTTNRNWIDINEAWQCQYWCARFRISEKVLREAVKEVGASAEDVRTHIAKRTTSVVGS